MKRIRIILFIALAALPVIIAIFTIVYIRVNTLYILPSEKYDAIGWWPHSNEKSIIDSFDFSSQKIVLEYTLYDSPCYAGFSLVLDRNYPFVDLSKYTDLTVKISSSKARHFGVIIQTFEKDVTQFKDGYYTPLRYLQIRTEITDKSDTYTVKLGDLKDPDWWISLNAPRGKALDKDPFRESAILQFFFDDIGLQGQEDRVEVDEIIFHPPQGFILIMLGIGTICYYLAYAGILVFPRLRRNIEGNREKLLSSYKRIDEKSGREKDAETVRQYIMEKYDNPDITLESISAETGISQKRITEIVRKEYAMTFKECINWLRIKESKRLLTETDMNITDIAFGLGFGSNSYFGSIFKSREKLSPKEYREKYRSAR
jgi:AraC-like DNA-binding protein